MGRVVSADHTVIAYERSGSGPAVILVGGGLDDGSENVPLAAALSARFTVYNYARRGRGESTDTSPYDVAREIEDIDALAGLSRTQPLMAFLLAMLLFSLAGIPPLAGFFAKFYVFLAAIHAGLYALAVIGVLLSVVGAYYYLRIVKIMYFDAPAERFEPMPAFLAVVLGATGAFNTKKTDWVDEVLKATDGKGVDVIVDFIGPETFAGNLKAIAKDGTIVSLATLSGPVMKPEMEMPNMVLFFAKRIRYEGSGLRSRDEEYQGKLRDQLVEHALPKFKDGTFKVFVEKVYPWEKIQDAHAQMERNETKGKLICTIS